MAEQRAGHGRLHLFLATAPGTGKTYALLAEGRRLAASGEDLVIGVAETHGRPDTDALVGDLEVVPLRRVAYRGNVTVAARKPSTGTDCKMSRAGISTRRAR